jgi:hypothetical protein
MTATQNDAPPEPDRRLDDNPARVVTTVGSLYGIFWMSSGAADPIVSNYLLVLPYMR